MTTPADSLMSATLEHVRKSGALTENCRMGEVSAVGTDGTITVSAAGETLPRVRLLSSYPEPTVGALVSILRGSGGWICLGAHIDYATSWQYPTLSSQFVQHGGGFEDARYRRQGGTVEVQGVVDAKPGESGDLQLFTLLPGYRPAKSQMYAATAAYGLSQLRAYPSGVFQIQNIASGSSYRYISISCSFTI